MMMTLIKKEIFELIKTKKIIVLPLVIMFFAMTSPIMAKYIAEIIGSMPAGEFEIIMPEPVMKHAYTQLLENYNQFVYFILMFLATGMFITDKTKGRLILLLSKPIKRSHLILSKYMVINGLFIVSVLLGSIFFIPYTIALFGEFDFKMYFLIILLYILYGIFLITLALLNSIIFKSFMASILVTITLFFTLMFFNVLTYKIAYLIPTQALALQGQLIGNTLETPNLIINILGTILFIGVLIYSSVIVFRSQEVE